MTRPADRDLLMIYEPLRSVVLEHFSWRLSFRNKFLIDPPQLAVTDF